MSEMTDQQLLNTVYTKEATPQSTDVLVITTPSSTTSIPATSSTKVANVDQQPISTPHLNTVHSTLIIDRIIQFTHDKPLVNTLSSNSVLSMVTCDCNLVALQWK